MPKLFEFGYDEVMFKCFSNVVPFSWRFLKTKADKLLGCVCDLHLLRKKYLLFNNLVEILGVSDLEWTRSVQHLVSEDSDAPDIDLAVVVFLLHYFWRSVERSATLSVSEHRSMDCPPEVTDFDSVLMQKNIFCFDVPMNYVYLVHKLNSRTYFLDVLFHISLFDRLFAQFLINISSKARLKQ